MIEFPPDAEGQRALLRRERADRGEAPLPEDREWCVVAWRLEVAGFHAGAADAWRLAVEAAPRLPRAHLGLGRALLDLGDAEGAAAAFRAAAEHDRRAVAHGVEPLLDDPDEDPSWGLGLAEHARGRHEEALAAYAACVDRHPYFPEPLLEMARCHAALGRPADAVAACRDAMARAPRRPEFRAEAEALLAALARRAR